MILRREEEVFMAALQTATTKDTVWNIYQSDICWNNLWWCMMEGKAVNNIASKIDMVYASISKM